MAKNIAYPAAFSLAYLTFSIKIALKSFRCCEMNLEKPVKSTSMDDAE